MNAKPRLTGFLETMDYPDLYNTILYGILATFSHERQAG